MMRLLNITIDWDSSQHVAPDVNLWYDEDYIMPGFEGRAYYNGDADDNLPLLQKINVAAKECCQALKDVIESDGQVIKHLDIIVADDDIKTVRRILGEITDALTDELMKRMSA